MIVDNVSEEQEAITSKKFSRWDHVLSAGLLDDPVKSRSAFRLLADPTVYAYAFFRQADGSPVRLYPYQDLIINDVSKRVLFAAANQIGKSFMLVVKAVHFAIMNPGKTVLLVSKTLPQSKDLLLQIRGLLNSSIIDFKASVGDSETKTEIYFRHYDVEGKELRQSRIICVPATGAALGYAADLLLLDELGFYDDGEYFYYQIAQPRTYTTKGQIMVFSNPNGQQGVLWRLWNEEGFSRYNFNYLDKPGNTFEEYEGLRVSLTREQFESTVDGVFTSPEGGFLSLSERRGVQEERPNVLPSVVTSPLFVFFDFAKAMDRTVRVIGVMRESGGGLPGVYVHEMKEYLQGTPYNEIVDDLIELVKLVGLGNICMVGWDNTGVGRGIEDFIKRVEDLGVSAVPVEFSSMNKSRMYTLFKLLVEQKRLSIPFLDECDKQLSCLRFKRSTRGFLMVHHESERDRDDFPDAIAGLCGLIVSPEVVPVTAEIV